MLLAVKDVGVFELRVLPDHEARAHDADEPDAALPSIDRRAARALVEVAGEEGLAKREAAIWLHEKTLSLEHAGQALSRYDVEYAPGDPGEAGGRPAVIRRPRLFEASYALAQLRLFGLDALGELGWLKAVRLANYAPRRPRPQALQDVLFPYPDAL